jgi:hypothetical protein
MRPSSKLLVPLLALLVFAALDGRAAADDSLYKGYNLTLKDSVTNTARRSLSILSKDDLIVAPTDVLTLGATLRVVSSTFDATYDMPASSWALGTAGKVRYRDTHTLNGPIRIADIYNTKFKLNGKGSLLLHTLATDPGAVSLVFTTGTTRLCFEFGGYRKFKADKILTAKGSAAPGACAN